MKTTTIRRGDTLSTLAKKNNTTVAELAKANKIKNPDKIFAGAKLVIPGKQDVFTPGGAKAPQASTKAPQGSTTAPGARPSTPAPQQTAPRGGDVFDSKQPQAPQKQPQAPQTKPQAPQTTPVATQQPQSTNTTEFVKNGRKFPSSNGYPVYAQGSGEPWAKKTAGTGTMGAYGCAVTAVTMAINGITGKTVTPGDMSDHVSNKGGFSKAGVSWETMGSVVKPGVEVKRHQSGTFPPDKIDKELAAGRPVAVHVDYKTGRGQNSRPGHDNQGDHWILITGRTKDGGYTANDPAGGKTITLHRKGNLLVGDDANNSQKTPYKTTGGAVTFDRGPARRPTTTSTQPTTQPTTKPTTGGTTTPAARPTGQGSTQATSGTTRVDTTSQRANDLTGNWQAKPGIDPNRYDSVIRDAAARHGVPARLVKAIIQQESHFDPRAGSSAGAQGLMQFMPKTWNSKLIGGGDIHDPKTNINAGAKYLGYLLKKFKGDVPTALAAYNYGEGNVGKNLARNGGKLNVAQLPAETRGYVRNIPASYNGTSYK